MRIADKQFSVDGSVKYLWKLDDDKTIESIYFHFRDKQYFCVSSQVGCDVKCPFCETGKQRNLRNLTSDEIYQQVAMALDDLGSKRNPIYQVAIAGMGEALLNFENVRDAAANLRKDDLTETVSVSTSGVVPIINKLAMNHITNLFISLHATTDAIRNRLVPMNRKFPIHQLLAAAKQFHDEVNTPVTITYLVLKDINDSEQDLERLIKLLDPTKFIIQLSEWNPIIGVEFSPSPRLEYFYQQLKTVGFDVFILRSMGKDIAGGCGQLRSRQLVNDNRSNS